MNSENSKPKDSEPKKKKSPFRWLLLLIPIVLGAIFFVEAILTKALTRQLENAGLKLGSLRVSSAGLDGIESIQVSDLEFPPEWTLAGVSIDLAELAISYELNEVFKTRKLDDITFKNLNLSVDLDEFTLPESEDGTGDYKDIPQTIFSSLPDAYPFQSLEIESGSLTLIKDQQLLAALPFQLSFHESGKLSIQSSKLQFKSTFNKKMGHAVAEVQYQLAAFPGVLTPLLQESSELPEFNGVSLTGNLSIANQQFKDASLFINVASADTPFGKLSGSTFRLNCKENLSPASLVIKTNYTEAKYDPVFAESGRLELNFNADLPSTFSFTSDRGKIQHLRYQDFSISAKATKSTIETNGKLTISGETIPWETKVDHPFFSKFQKWLQAPDFEFPTIPENEEILNALAVEFGPVQLNESDQLNVFLEGIPYALISGEISATRKAGERIAQIKVKDGIMDFPESGLKISGVQYSSKLSDKPALRTIETSTLEIDSIQFGDLSLKNGKLPITLSTNVEGNPVLIIEATDFDALGGKVSLGLTSVEINGADTTTTGQIILTDIQSKEILKLLDVSQVGLDGQLEGLLHFVYNPSGMTLSNGHLSIKPESTLSAQYDAKGALTSQYRKGSPEWKQMNRIEGILKDIEISNLKIHLDPSEDSPEEALRVVLNAKHKSHENDVGLQLQLSLWDREQEPKLTSNGKITLFDEEIPWETEIPHPWFSQMSKWLHNPSPDNFPELPKESEILPQVELSAGPLKLEKSALVNSLIPGLPDTHISGTFSASRKRGENAVQVHTDISEISVPEQEVVISNLSTNPLIGWGSSVFTVQPATLNIGKISVKKLELQNGELPWVLHKEGILQTPGCKFDTLGGSVSLGGTAVKLKGSETMTTGLLTMQNIDFEQILALADKPPLQLKGVFNGQLPFLFNMEKLEPAMGGFLQMQSESEGHLEYDAKGRFTQNQKPGSRGWKNMDMAERALKDLNISGITLHFLPEEDPLLPLRAVIKGSHQTNNQKINLELTLNLRGDIKEILKKAAQGNLELVP